MATLRDLPVPLPPTKAEQEAIAEALSDADALIESLEQLLVKKRQLKQGSMQQLLTGKKRLPGFSGEWVPTTMSSIGATYGGLSGKTKDDFGVGDAQYVTFLNVLENVSIECEQFDCVRVAVGEGQNLVRKGDLLFNGTSETPEDLAMGAVLLDEVDELYLNSFCFGFRIRVSQEQDALFIAYFFRGSVGRSIMYSLAQGSTRYNMSKRQFLDLELTLPAYKEQVAIAIALGDMEAEIVALEAKLTKARQLKQGMMQELLTGRIRLI